jgi:hypothetical protein
MIIGTSYVLQRGLRRLRRRDSDMTADYFWSTSHFRAASRILPALPREVRIR